MSTNSIHKNILSSVAFLSLAVAVFDYIVRTFTLGWAEAGISQATVFLSPLVYFILFTLVLFKLRNLAQGRSEYVYITSCVLLILWAAAVLVQVFFRKDAVGSATYSVVTPLLASGVPFTLLTFLLFFREKRGSFQSYLICLACVFWLVIPIGIDTLYLTQGGYRGPSALQIAVISTTYDLIQYIAAFGVFVAPITMIAIVIITIYRTLRAKGIARLYTIAVGSSILALSIQFINWGGFVWD